MPGIVISRWQTGSIRDRRGTPGKPYLCRYTPEDVALLAKTDRLHERLSGSAIRHICQHQEFGDERYLRLALISIGHLYNLHRNLAYLRLNRRLQSTQSVTEPALGERRCPQPEDRPGFLRIDTVHQGDLRDLWDCQVDQEVFYLNMVDEVRKQFGYGHIPVGFYEDINRFTADVLAEHLNFHRPCWFPRLMTDRKGKITRQYYPQDLMTPFEKFCSLPNAGAYLRPDVTLAQLQAQAHCRSDNESTERLLRERRKLFKPILESLGSAA